jgi:serine/threonine protein kinase
MYVTPFRAKNLISGTNASSFHFPDRLVEGITRKDDPVHRKQFKLTDFDKIEKIGEGTFGKVYKAEYIDPVTKKVSHFALKKLNMLMEEMTDQGFPLTALREIKYLSMLDHDNIVRIRQVINSKRKSIQAYRVFNSLYAAQRTTRTSIEAATSCSSII